MTDSKMGGTSKLVIYILIAIVILAVLMLITNLLRCYLRKKERRPEVNDQIEAI